MKTNLRYVGKQLGIVPPVGCDWNHHFAVGLVIGYGVIGDGKIHGPFSPDTWSEIIGKLTGK